MTNSNIKKYHLGYMAGMATQMREKIQVLEALDRDTTQTGSYDLTDQLVTMNKYLDGLEAVINRAVSVTGGDDDPRFDVNDSFLVSQTIMYEKELIRALKAELSRTNGAVEGFMLRAQEAEKEVIQLKREMEFLKEKK